MDAQAAQQIDVDELAKEKVQEVENLLESSDNIKLDTINSWFSILKQIITAADLHRTNDKNGNTESAKIDESIYADYSDDNERFNSVDLTEQFATNSVKWTIRVKAFKLVHQLVQMPNASKSLVLKHLSDLIRLSFVAATSPYDDLKTQGFEMFKFLINRFAAVEEKEFPGHSILEQYRTQVLSALKPAFNLDAPPYITAIASQVCCLWISRGLEMDSVNLKRTYQLMILTIDKLENQSINQNSKLYTESELEQERLNILGSWAHLFITAKETGGENTLQDSCKSSDLLDLVKPQIGCLIDKWWEALKDYALLIMPAPRIIGTSHDNEHVYTREVALRLFAPVWYKLILASTSWLCSDDLTPHETNHSIQDQVVAKPIEGANENETSDISSRSPTRTNKTKYLKFICGILMKEFCRCHSEDLAQQDSLAEATLFAIRSLFFLVNNEEMQSAFIKDLTIPQEFYTIVYSIYINGIKLRSQHQLLLKSLLDKIFKLVTQKVKKNSVNMKYAIAYYSNLIDQSLSVLEQSYKSDDATNLETIKTNLAIVTNRIIGILKFAPNVVVDEKDLQNTLIIIFRKLICFESDMSISMSFLEQSRDLCTLLPPELYEIFSLDLLKSQVNMASRFIDLIYCDESTDKMIHSVQYLETYLRGSKSIITTSSANNRKALITFYLETLLETLLKLNETNQEKVSPGKNMLVLLVIKHIEDLNRNYSEDFDEIMDSKKRDILDSATTMHQNIKTENETKRNSKPVDKSTSVPKKTSPSKPAAKITLRADFSNFYAKKS